MGKQFRYTRPERLIVNEIVAALQSILEDTRDRTEEEIRRDRHLHQAVLWNFAILGEASSQLSDDFKMAHPEIPWSHAVRVRNRIIHGYWSVEPAILLTTAARELPMFMLDMRRVQLQLESVVLN